MDEYETPLGNLTLDKQIMTELFATKAFGVMKRSVDEEEHSIEMQLPYIMKMLQGANFTIIPILVGSVSKEMEAMFGEILSKYLNDPSNFFVISSDFCHWGRRFSYTHYDQSNGPIWKSIEQLDREGMGAIESLQPEKFYSYQKRTKNTICGRHPIGVMMQIIKSSKLSAKLKFVHYEQSSQCEDEDDSSVSYASAVVSML